MTRSMDMASTHGLMARSTQDGGTRENKRATVYSHNLMVRIATAFGKMAKSINGSLMKKG
jgi:hypothetical protein